MDPEPLKYPIGKRPHQVRARHRQMVLGPPSTFRLPFSEQLLLELPNALVSSPVLIWPKQEEDLD